MHLVSQSFAEVHVVDYLSAGAKGQPERARLPVLAAQVEQLPTKLDAIICTGDLQGIVKIPESGDKPKLLGEVLAEELCVLLELAQVSPKRTGVILTGDFFSAPGADQRGVSGDVRPVWQTFLQRFRWVAGVLGNHDYFGASVLDFNEFIRQPNLHYLDGTSVSLDGLNIAGVSGILGNPLRPLGRSAQDYAGILTRLNAAKPNVIVMHQSPAVSRRGTLGSEEVGVIYQHQSFPLTICGHVSWPTPCVEMSNGNQLLNVDSRAVILLHQSVQIANLRS